MNDIIRYHKSVQQAFRDKKPVVALESTVIAHGLPYPKNYETALELEEIIRVEGATPATIAVMDGKLCVGLSSDELLLLSTSGQVLKLSSRDIAYALAQKKLGATTVSATMRIAAMSGIFVFATGGIGGVHRDGHISFDISADLTELVQTPVAVVCAGAKSILDLGRTLEYLETLAVPVIGFNTDQFPAFYSRASGLSLPMSTDSVDVCASIIRHHRRLAPGGLVIAQPIPAHYELDGALVEQWILAALLQAQKEGIRGPKTTPFVLDYLFHISEGKTLAANVALLKENAALAARISKSLAG